MPRYVILRHEPTSVGGKPLHWDVMFEFGGVLRTWAIAVEPPWEGPIMAERLADHRLEYLEYEGLLTGDRGRVTRWDDGTYELDRESSDEFQVRLNGQRLNCGLAMSRDSRVAHQWMASFSRADSAGSR